MIIKIGNIFESNAQTLVNTVNCVGVMGKGIAFEFKQRYPDMYREYCNLCKEGSVFPGIPYLHTGLGNISIINFPTKNHWRSPSKLSYIISGLNWFRDNYKALEINSVAFPPLGCGNGGLPWDVVGPIMYTMLKDLPIDVEIYAPFGTAPEKLTIKFLSENVVKSPKELIGNNNIPFNKYWLLLLYIVQKLNNDKYSLNVGRTIFQKICYVLTRTGIPTGFNFVAREFGPYAAEVKDAIMVLSNTNLMSEQKLGRMVETVVSPNFKLPENQFSFKDIEKADQAFDLLSRVKSTQQAELIATILFSYDELIKQNITKLSDTHIYDYVMKWKPRWKVSMSSMVMDTINDLAILGFLKLYKATEDKTDNFELF